MRFTGRDIALMQRPQFIPGGLVIDPVVDWPRPLMKPRRILGDPRLCRDYLALGAAAYSQRSTSALACANLTAVLRRQS